MLGYLRCKLGGGKGEESLSNMANAYIQKSMVSCHLTYNTQPISQIIYNVGCRNESSLIMLVKYNVLQMSNMATIVTTTLASAKAAASGSNDGNARGDAFNPQNII